VSEEMVTQLVLIAVVALGFLAAVWFYESLTIRDVYLTRVMRVVRRRTSRPMVVGVTYVACIVIVMPVLVWLWAAVLTFALWAIESVDRTASSAFVATSVIGATRVLAYIRQQTAHELAKAIPLAFAFLLLTGGALNLDQKLQRLSTDTGAFDITPEMLQLLIGIELILRLTTDGSHALLGAIRRRRGIDDDRGVWRTLWAAVRRPTEPISAMLGDPETTDS
jgi:hypothetical protein